MKTKDTEHFFFTQLRETYNINAVTGLIPNLSLFLMMMYVPKDISTEVSKGSYNLKRYSKWRNEVQT